MLKLKKLKIMLRDWWRGFTNDDIASALRKLEKPCKPGEVVWLSPAEMLAWRAYRQG